MWMCTLTAVLPGAQHNIGPAANNKAVLGAGARDEEMFSICVGYAPEIRSSV
jgi:hypothetical protein